MRVITYYTTLLQTALRSDSSITLHVLAINYRPDSHVCPTSITLT